uniref:Uncharacterized protein n=1 Tax=Usinis virus TaxID=2800948 RepID=A0A894KQK0_9VIRU|nr:MAG: hypothetical protein 3 [Usinis virus]QRW42709.1 MAG: hypothetical protein 3 [Usinis virus]QRW42710.1 MAG: hypothetical protein 3 [Usinis virus]
MFTSEQKAVLAALSFLHDTAYRFIMTRMLSEDAEWINRQNTSEVMLAMSQAASSIDNTENFEVYNRGRAALTLLIQSTMDRGIMRFPEDYEIFEERLRTLETTFEGIKW